MKEFGFVYLWRDKKHNRYYIGSHWGTEDDGYICSSNWMRDAFRRRQEDFKRRIIKRIYTNRTDTFLAEQYYLDMIKPEEIKIRYYNLALKVKHWTMYPERVKSITDKISYTLNEKLKNGWNRKHSEETKQKLKDGALKRAQAPSQACIEAIKKANSGKKHSQEHIEKAARDRKGKIWINNGEIHKFIKPEDLPFFIDSGFKKGKLEKTRKLLSEKNRDRDMVGAKNPFYGKTHSEDTKRKMSDARKGRTPWNKGLKKDK